MQSVQQTIDWFGAFDIVCHRADGALEWGLPEPWLHAELYAELKRRSIDTGWIPFPQELHYVTHYPVQLPSESNRDWKTQGAVKWIDLCLHHGATNTWCWFEFKVRHCGIGNRVDKASFQARDAFRKDVIALAGFSAALTASTWETPDEYTKIYWAETLLKPRTDELVHGRHEFVAAYLQLNGSLDLAHWSGPLFRGALDSWLAERVNRLKNVAADAGSYVCPSSACGPTLFNAVQVVRGVVMAGQSGTRSPTLDAMSTWSLRSVPE